MLGQVAEKMRTLSIKQAGLAKIEWKDNSILGNSAFFVWNFRGKFLGSEERLNRRSKNAKN